MYSENSGGNITRAAKRTAVLLGLAIVFAGGCGEKKADQTASAASDEKQIQDVLTEVITRWHYGDKAGLYDNEFEYFRERYTFDDYLKFGEMRLDADTVEAINAKEIKLFGRDSALIDAEVVFKGPTGKISRLRDATTQYKMYYHRGRWIRPTISQFDMQQRYEQSRREADSAAEAEAKELGDQ